VITRCAAACVLMSSAIVAADPYPSEIVRRAPWLPEGMTEVDASVDALFASELPHPAGVYDTVVTVRHALRYVEPFVGVRLRYDRLNFVNDPYYARAPGLDVLQTLDAGARVPISCLSDFAVRFTWIAPKHHLYRGLMTDLSYEWRLWLSPRWGVAGEVGVSLSHESQILEPVRPDDPLYKIDRWDEWAHGRVGVDLQSSGPVALEAGLFVTKDVHDYYATLTYATSPLDVLVQIAVVPFEYSNDWIVTTSGAYRF